MPSLPYPGQLIEVERINLESLGQLTESKSTYKFLEFDSTFIGKPTKVFDIPEGSLIFRPPAVRILEAYDGVNTFLGMYIEEVLPSGEVIFNEAGFTNVNIRGIRTFIANNSKDSPFLKKLVGGGRVILVVNDLGGTISTHGNGHMLMQYIQIGNL